MKKRSCAILATISVVVVALAGFLVYHYAFKRSAHPVSVAPISVTLTPITTHKMKLGTYAYGIINAPQSIDIKSRVDNAVVASIEFKNGQFVKKGQILFTIESINLADKKASLKAIYLDKEQLFKRLQQANNEYSQTVSKSVLETAKNAYESAKADYMGAKRELATSIIKSPIDGYMSDTDLSVGSVIHVGDLLASVVQNNHLEVLYPLDEKYKSQVKLDQLVIVTTEAYPNTVFHAKVTYISPQLDASTSTIRFRASLENSDLQLSSGMYAKVEHIFNPKANILAVPFTIVGTDSTGFYVFVVNKNQKLEKRYFQADILDKDGLMTVISGLKEGTLTVSSDVSQLAEGQLVKVVIK